MNTQDYKDIKIVGVNTQKVMANNEVWWEQNNLLKPDYEFYDSEIGKNSNWSKHKTGYWYLNKFTGQYVVFIRHYIIQNKNKLGKFVANMYIGVSATGDENGYGFYFYTEESYLMAKSEDILFPENPNDNTYKTYVFVCSKEYSAEYEQKLIEFANSL